MEAVGAGVGVVVVVAAVEEEDEEEVKNCVLDSKVAVGLSANSTQC